MHPPAARSALIVRLAAIATLTLLAGSRALADGPSTQFTAHHQCYDYSFVNSSGAEAQCVYCTAWYNNDGNTMADASVSVSMSPGVDGSLTKCKTDWGGLTAAVGTSQNVRVAGPEGASVPLLMTYAVSVHYSRPQCSGGALVAINGRQREIGYGGASGVIRYDATVGDPLNNEISATVACDGCQYRNNPDGTRTFFNCDNEGEVVADPSIIVDPNWPYADLFTVEVFDGELGKWVPAAPPPSDVDGDGFEALAGDCNDFDATIHPGAVEVPDDDLDQDCSGGDDHPLGASNGTSCEDDADCRDGACVTGICCETRCGDGAADDCQSCLGAETGFTDGVCAPLAAGTECRPSDGLCDYAEVCDGAHLECPGDARRWVGDVCRASASACDVPETCIADRDADGAFTTTCPADAVLSSEGQGEPCDTGLAGACAPGTLHCGTCVATASVPETCNGQDDDCDGVVDQGYAGLGDFCFAGFGVCQAGGAITCDADGHGAHCEPSYVAGTPSDERCNGQDDDCDGSVDEGLGGTVGEACTVGSGACASSGTWACSPFDEALVCDAPLLPGQTNDSDGDGTVDCADGCPDNAQQVAPDACGCGHPFIVCVDRDGDGALDDADNCPDTPNSDQANLDGDGVGDACDSDDDNDGAGDDLDVCPSLADPDQSDGDGDGAGDACDADDDNDDIPDGSDLCPLVADPEQLDLDGDGAGDACDPDDDGDGALDVTDNCRAVENASQADADQDGQGDACDPDDDGDGVADLHDNCAFVPNAAQADLDQDHQGDACDGDDDGDEVADADDDCPGMPDATQDDLDGDGLGDACDPDPDGDGVVLGDVCPWVSDPAQADLDHDGLGDACDGDDDGDGVSDDIDRCPRAADDQADLDADGAGDACDDDDDGDGVADGSDRCARLADDQADLDEDGAGDACDDDDDGDGVADGSDLCPRRADPDQADLDGDGLGDACDADIDGDGVGNGVDRCPTLADDQADLDGDGRGDACDDDEDGDGLADALDLCPRSPVPELADLDGDGVGDACDPDDDGDGVPDDEDLCPALADPEQWDGDGDGIGDACDTSADSDGDGVVDDADNCPAVANGDQHDLDGDRVGDACDPDGDGDGVGDSGDNCLGLANGAQNDWDQDGLGDACDPDDDGDGVGDAADDCPWIADPAQVDHDADRVGDACDGDDDDDGAADDVDNCALVVNTDQIDLDGDGVGDACDDDDDDDTVPDGVDVCPRVADEGQEDFDGDGLGDACDPDDDDDGVADGLDLCPGTIGGIVVDPSTGCDAGELCPCAGPLGSEVDWDDHGQYVSCVTQAARRLRNEGHLSAAQAASMIAAAARTSCGVNPCRRNPLRDQASSTAPYLTLAPQQFLRWGAASPAGLRVFAGLQEVFAGAGGRFVVPLVAANGRVIVDTLQPNELGQRLPHGAFVVLRRGRGEVVMGLSGNFRGNAKVAASIVVAVERGLAGAARNRSFERQGDGRALLGSAGQDEFWDTGPTLRIESTVTRAADLLHHQYCR